MSLLQTYKAFVKQHPSLVLNLERVLHWVTYWSPERFSNSEYAYEAFSAAVGLLGIYNESILAETPEYTASVAKWALWLAAVEQVQTLVELRAIQLEQKGKMSRYGPLMALELVKALLRLQLWRSSKCTLALESLSKEDQEQHECEQQLKELLQAFTRLRERYSYEPLAVPTAEQLRWKEQLQREQAVRAAALAPNRPPAACAAGGLVRSGSLGLGSGSFTSSSGGSNGHAAVAGVGLGLVGSAGSISGSSSRCSACGAALSPQQSGTGGNSSDAAPAQQQQHYCQSCGTPQLQQRANINRISGLSEIVPADPQGGGSKMSKVASGSKGLSKGWWQRIASLYPSSSRPSTAPAAMQQPTQHAAPGAAAVPSSWGPGSAVPYSKSPATTPRCHQRSSSSSAAATLFSFYASRNQKQQQQVMLEHNPWCLSNQDDRIGHYVMQIGELVHLLRPLVYVALLKRYGLRSWKPWMVSLMLDLASEYGLHTGHAILTHSNASRWPPGSTLYSLALLRSLSNKRWTPSEQTELLGRKAQLLRYLLRSPCYDAVTRRLLQKIVAASRWAPGLSNLTEFAFSMVEGMQSYYTYVEC